MSSKRVVVEDLGEVTLYKRRGVKNIRLSVTAGNRVRVTLPSWAPYKVGVDFIQKKLGWIKDQFSEQHVLYEGRLIGKAHRMRFVTATGGRIITRLKGNEILVGVPRDRQVTDSAVQSRAAEAAIRALKREAEHLLPRRLAILATAHGFDYRGIRIKRLEGRWGSCNQHKDIVLNCFLMELPWDLIDYVILHELVHTRVMAHGPRFWGELDRYVPNLAAVREVMRSQHPAF